MMLQANKLECLVLVRAFKHLHLKPSGTAFKTLFFFLTYKWTQKASVKLHLAVKAARNEHSSLLGQFIGYKKLSVVNTAPDLS
jgi:hypothetical protein